MFFDTKECEWSDLEIYLNGVKLTKIRSLKYKVTTEKEHLYAAGADPIGISRGNNAYEGEIKLLKGAFDDIKRACLIAGASDILDVSFIVVANYRMRANRLIQVDTLTGLEFTEYERGMEQNAKFMEVTLPFKFLNLISI